MNIDRGYKNKIHRPYGDDSENTNNKYRPYRYRLKNKNNKHGDYKHGAMTMNRLASTVVRGQGMNLVINN